MAIEVVVPDGSGPGLKQAYLSVIHSTISPPRTRLERSANTFRKKAAAIVEGRAGKGLLVLVVCLVIGVVVAGVCGDGHCSECCVHLVRARF